MQIIPCKGTIVTAIDIGVVDQLIFQRVAVEGMVFRDFVQSCSPMEILAVEHLFNLLLEAAEARNRPEEFDFNNFLRCDLAMHQYWFHKTSKEYLWEQMTRPQADYSRFIRLDILGARNVPSVVSEHREMLRILKEKAGDSPKLSRQNRSISLKLCRLKTGSFFSAFRLMRILRMLQISDSCHI